jgi:GH18 family chitinase
VVVMTYDYLFASLSRPHAPMFADAFMARRRQTATPTRLFGGINVSMPDISSPGREQAVYNYQQPPAEQRLFWQGFYDDAQGLRYKYEMVKALGLRGVLMWDLDACALGAAHRTCNQKTQTPISPVGCGAGARPPFLRVNNRCNGCVEVNTVPPTSKYAQPVRLSRERKHV